MLTILIDFFNTGVLTTFSKSYISAKIANLDWTLVCVSPLLKIIHKLLHI